MAIQGQTSVYRKLLPFLFIFRDARLALLIWNPVEISTGLAWDSLEIHTHCEMSSFTWTVRSCIISSDEGFDLV